MNISILYPDGMKPEELRSISDTTWHDLGFDRILEAVTGDRKEQAVIRHVMMHLTDDPAAAAFRLEVFDDLLHRPELRSRVQSLLARISQLEDHMSPRSTLGKSDSIWTLMRRLREIDEYIECVETLGDCLGGDELKSRGLRELAAYIRTIREESAFEALRKDIRELRVMTSQVKSITLGINLDENYETRTIGIVSLNDKAFTRTGLLGSFTNRITSGDRIHHGTDWNGHTTFEPVDTEPVNNSAADRAGRVLAAASSPLMAAAMGMAAIKDNEMARNTVGFVEQVMNQMMASGVKALKETLARYVTVDIHSITNLIPEFLYYVRWADKISKLQEEGYLFGPASVTEAHETITMEAKDIYNLKLAITGAVSPAEIVTNDLDFCPERNCYLLTGANRGGKTTITQAVGQAFLLAQGGIYIPGKCFRFTPADSVYTHFPADEDKTMDFGRLGEECSRFRDLYAEATAHSLVLLNESFSTTSFEEGYYIAYDAVRALLRKGCRTIFNTHMHKLAQGTAQLNAHHDSDCKAASLIVMTEEGSRRSYRLAVAPPEGTSYARDIAVKYGLTFEQLVEE